MNCITWYEAFAFCAWDGARLATSAEWNYAAAGGAEQRVFPWSQPPSSTTIDATYVVYSPAQPRLASGTLPGLRGAEFFDGQYSGRAREALGWG